MAYDRPLSYSGISLYKKCPRAWKDAYIDGNRSVPGPAAMRGTELHKRLEDYFTTGEYPMADRVLRAWMEYMGGLAGGSPEQGLAIDRDFWACDFDDTWAYVRGNVDLIIDDGELIKIYDWKSGKEYESHAFQSEIYAMLAYFNYPASHKVEVTMVYLDQPHHTVTRTYDDYNIDDICKDVTILVDAITLDEEYAPTPSNDACRFCPLSWRKGGSCDKAP